ncbi:MAG: cyclohexanecarboxylate-CoA ligase [Acidimicrobiales bacterium]|nr:MAG: cyclohexanecarboxylate-CoA ligase [Acidimicrobiales bacterium]
MGDPGRGTSGPRRGHPRRPPEYVGPGAFRSVVDPAVAASYRSDGWWGDITIANLVASHARTRPDRSAFVTEAGRLSWRDYHDASDRLAKVLLSSGLEAGERLGVFLADGATIHVSLLAAEKAGLIAVGIGARSGDREMRHLLHATGATALLTAADHNGDDWYERVHSMQTAGLPIRHHFVVPEFADDAGAAIVMDGRPAEDSGPGTPDLVAARRMGPDDLFLINSTSGTTGLPKCVAHTQNSKLYMASQAIAAAEMTDADVMLGAAPMPFGFGLFSTHFTGTVLGATVVTVDRFSADIVNQLIERERVTVLVCVSTQFKMMMTSPSFDAHDLSSLRAMFTGGEAIPYEPASRFEKRTGAAVLNFYGSNESGMATGTTIRDSFEHRLETCGRAVAGTDVKLFDDRGDATKTGYGQPGSRGPASCLGYYDDPAANDELFADGRYVLHADFCTIDEDGYLAVVGRRSDIIIRGGKNLSALQVENEVMAHPDVGLVAAVAMPDALFGERVCVFVELVGDADVTLEELTAFMVRRGVSKELLPESLVVVDTLPRSAGGKVAKGTLRLEAERRAMTREGDVHEPDPE